MSIRLKKNLARLAQWAKGDTRKVESAPLPELTQKSAADPAFDKQCGGKEAFPSKKAADAAQLYRERQGVPGQGMVAYNCKFCHQWHLGHSRSK